MRPHDLSRRDFLELTALGAVATAAPSVRPSTADSRQPTAEPRPFELDDATIGSLQAAMRSGKYTSQRITQLYLNRIDEIDRKGPTLRSVIETNPEALAIAAALDAERRAGRVRGPLHGIPVLIKDNIATGDRMLTTAGSLALAQAPAPRDAFIVKQLRDAGAVIIGKTNLSEWANFRSTKSVSGWSGRGGLCRNPYALDRNACGSSSGTGAAIAASLATVGVGTETDGSIVCPSSANSLVGIKPTLGMVSRSGIIPIAHSQDTAGPMCRTVEDAAILLDVLSGVDPSDPATRVPSPKSPAPSSLRGARIGVARANFWGYSASADRLVNAAIEIMKGQGAVIVDPADIPHVGEYDDAEFTVLLYEFKDGLNRYLQGLGTGGSGRTLRDLIDFNEQNKAREMPYFGQEIFIRAQEKGPLTDDAYVEALARCRRLSRPEGLDAVMAEHRLDAIIAPTGSPPWSIDLVNGDHFLGASSTPAAVSGYPSVCVPVGYSFGLPVGMSFIGKPWSEAALIKYAFAYEQAAKVRKAPKFLATADLSTH